MVSGEKSCVAVLKASPESVKDDYARLLSLADFGKSLSWTTPTKILLDYYYGDRFFPAASAAPWEFEYVAKAILDGNAGRLAVYADGLSGFRSRGKCAYQTVLDRCEGRIQNGFAHRSRSRQRALPASLDTGRHNVVILSTVKTHLVHFTCGTLLWNAVCSDSYPGPSSFFLSADEICDRFEERKKSAQGLFGVLDGTLAGDGPGPRHLRLFSKNIILASHDLVALDAVASRMMGFDPMSVPYLRRAHERGLGRASLGEIDVVGMDIGSVDFRFHHTEGMSSRWLFKAIRNAFKSGELGRPLKLGRALEIFFLKKLSDVYIRRVWFPRYGGERLCRAYQTGWGKLLREYGL